MARSRITQRFVDGAFLAASLLLGTSGCSEQRERPGQAVPCVTWQDEIAGMLDEHCVACHDAEEPAGDYVLSDYQGALGAGTDDEPNAIAGERDSLLLRMLDPGTADSAHDVDEDVRDALGRWVTECNLAYRRSSIHPVGILNPRDPDFHGALLAQRGWRFDECRTCHGEELAGGPAEASCLSCHEEGPTDCNTCHSAALRRQGAHGAHLTGNGMLPFDECSQCHPTPESYTDSGHLFVDEPGGVIDTRPAELEFGRQARMTLEGASRSAEPSWDSTTQTCSEVYCHGATLDDPAASSTMPRWRIADEDQAACGTCHGMPPADHGQDECVRCHSRVVDEERNIIDEPLHIDGMSQIGPAGTEGCPRCHGTEDSAAPPPDLQGGVDETLPTVGAHRAHLQAPFRLSAPIECGDCHRVPERVQAAGHVDTALPAEVFPDAIVDSSLAFARGASPIYNRRSETCSDVYCHGGGEVLEGDPAEGVSPTPQWAAEDPIRIGCGDCHGVPPADDTHGSVTSLRECHDCHSSVDDYGNILFSGPADAPRSQHLDGDVDAE